MDDLRGMDGNDKERLIVIAIVSQLRVTLHTLRRRPLDFTGGKSFGQLPLENRRLAGVSGIDPVDMPAGFQDEMNSQLQSAARSDGVLPGNQLHVSMGQRDRFDHQAGVY